MQDIYKILKEIIKNEFPLLQENDYNDLLAEAYVYIDEKHSINQMIGDNILKDVIDHLRKYYSELKKEKAGIKSLGRSGVTPVSKLTTESSETRSDDEVLSSRLLLLKRNRHWAEEDDNAGEEEENLKFLEDNRERLRKLLSPFEYEILHNRTSDEIEQKKQRLTFGFHDLGLFIMLRRARIHMVWIEKSEEY